MPIMAYGMLSFGVTMIFMIVLNQSHQIYLRELIKNNRGHYLLEKDIMSPTQYFCDFLIKILRFN